MLHLGSSDIQANSIDSCLLKAFSRHLKICMCVYSTLLYYRLSKPAIHSLIRIQTFPISVASLLHAVKAMSYVLTTAKFYMEIPVYLKKLLPQHF